MLSFLSSLFSSVDRPSEGPDRSLIEAAIERVVDATDPRLRMFSNYQKRLYPGVQRSVAHVQGLIDSLPEPVEISRRAFGSDPRLRAFFASPARMQEAIGSAPTLVDFLASRKGPYPDHIFGLLASQMKERQALGMQLNGDQVRRDVLQEVVSFSDHRFFGAAGSEEESRGEMKKAAFDYLAELALKRILGMEEKRSELEQQRRLLQRKLDAMRKGNWGMEPVLSNAGDEHPDHRSLGERIEAVEDELMALPCSQASLEQRFECINAILEQPEDGVSLRPIQLRIDAMSVKVQDSADESYEPLQLIEMLSSSGERRIMLFGYFPRDELPPERDFFKEAGRYLG
ncbi:MAG: hypothetical protein KJN79_07745 [Gammaproteobacteria bacterium]|nr:hypothetical protein [Gammaproteobacteria bacterium]